MNLAKKKQLAAKTLGVGKNRIKFNPEGFDEIKEAITKEDIRTLNQNGIISIKPINGRKAVEKRTTRRGFGKIKIKVKNRKRDYVRITRRLRWYLKMLKSEGKISKEDYLDLRRKIKMRTFKNKAQFKEYVDNLKGKKAMGKTKETAKSKPGKVKQEKARSTKIMETRK